ncbi:patatin-like phospholipase family protein [Microvirga yunnanensis]|uniref:patatin-like phospholipase family protein n=1 Tax=Microvirga yunnanensis TaxID=2953740 RepID=UPI0021C994CD|nr:MULTISPECIES: patatin-like phospholipase family protein [unclassified Microvirga]
MGLLGLFSLAACGTLPRTPYTATDAASSEVLGVPGVRRYADEPAAAFRADATALAARPARMPLTYLALSGGGAYGAYGAGVLNGWTAAGIRPEFTFVSGVSTGALIAPFAFLGPSYDAKLREVYTSGVAESLLDSPDLLNVVFGSSLFGGRRLRELIARSVDDAMLAAVAAAHANGRRLFVVTTNLDSQRAVIWDMGRIASSGSPQALGLFRDVLAASASVPGVFPPRLIDAEANGRRFEEMHVDGSVMAPVFTLPDTVLLASAPPLRGPRVNIYVLMNNKVDPDFQVVPDKAAEIGGRAASTSVKAQTKSVLFGTYAAAQRNGFGFNLTFIDQDVPSSTSAGFDTAYMRRLYQYGFEKARSGRLWVRRPPSGALAVVRRMEEASGGRREALSRQLEQD